MELVSQSLTGKYLKIQLVHIWFADAGINVQAFYGFYSYSFWSFHFCHKTVEV